MAAKAGGLTSARTRTRAPRREGSAWLLGASLPLLGLSLGSAAGSGVQPAAIAALIHLGAALSRRGLRLRPASLAWAAAMAGSMLIAATAASAPARAWTYFVPAAGALGLYALAMGDILASGDARRSFLRGLVGCAAVSAMIGLLQVAYSAGSGGGALTLAFNPTFAISSQPYRASAFAPEASVLFPHLALALLLVLSRTLAADIGLSRRGRIAAAAALGAGLLATRSSSLLWFGPLLTVHYLLLVLRRDVGKAEAGGFVLALILAAAVFAAEYAARLSASDADISASIRIAKIQAAASVFAQHPLFGAGLGAASDPQVIGSNLPAWFVGTAAGQMSHAGVDSTLVRTAMEQGLVGVLLYLSPVVAAVLNLGARDPRRRAMAGGLLVAGVSFWFAVGYRDVPLSAVIGVWALELGPMRRRRASTPPWPDRASPAVWAA